MKFMIVDNSSGEVNAMKAADKIDAAFQILDNLGIEILTEEEFGSEFPDGFGQPKQVDFGPNQKYNSCMLNKRATTTKG